MKEPVQVHGRYGCKSAYETYKRFARTNTRLGVRPRRGHERVGEKDAGGKRRGLGLRWIQMRINIYKRVRRWSSLLDSYLESGMRTLRGNIGSRTALRNETCKEKGWRKREKKEQDIGGAESRDASGISAIESPWPNLTDLEFSGWWIPRPAFTF